MTATAIAIEPVSTAPVGVPLFHYRLRDCDALNQRLVEAAHAERQRDSSGIKYGGDAWHSADKLHQVGTYSDLLATLDAAIGLRWQEVGWTPERMPWSVGALWVNITPPGTTTPEHAHFGHAKTMFGVVYYARVPPGSGNLRARSRDMYCSTIGEVTLTDYAPFNVPYWLEVEPHDGDIIILPNWLWHAVTVNRSQDERVAWTALYHVPQLVQNKKGTGFSTTDVHPDWHTLIANDARP
jgi:uncharacterized protein (TIGR02466 family)